MFNLKIDEEIHLRNIHPDDAETLFNLIEQNRARLHLWIDPYALPKTAKAARLFTIHCLITAIRLAPVSSINISTSWNIIFRLSTIP